MNQEFKKLVSLCFVFLIMAPAVHADIFSDIGGTVGGFFNSVANIASPVIGAITNTIGGFISGVTSFFTGGTTQPTAPQISVPGDVPPGGYSSLDLGDSTGGPIGGSLGGYYPTYVSKNVEYVNVKEVGFSHLELTALYHKTIIENDVVIAGNYVQVFNEITNIGSMVGTTKWQTEIKCFARDIAGNKVSNYKTVFRTDWIESGDLAPGSVNSFLFIWSVPEPKYNFGGECLVNSEISDNVRNTTIIENIFCTIISWASGDTTQDCSTTQEQKDVIETRGKTELAHSFVIAPRRPMLYGSISTGIGVQAFE